MPLLQNLCRRYHDEYQYRVHKREVQKQIDEIDTDALSSLDDNWTGEPTGETTKIVVYAHNAPFECEYWFEKDPCTLTDSYIVRMPKMEACTHADHKYEIASQISDLLTMEIWSLWNRFGDRADYIERRYGVKTAKEVWMNKFGFDEEHFNRVNDYERTNARTHPFKCQQMCYRLRDFNERIDYTFNKYLFNVVRPFDWLWKRVWGSKKS